MAGERQVALVTGASSGLGRMIARDLAGAGHVAYASMRNTSGGNATIVRTIAEEASREGIDLRTIEMDVQDEASIEATVPTIVYGHVHCKMVTIGNLESDRKMEFTVVGDVVNVASRLEKAARELECTLVVSDACMRAAGDAAPLALFSTQLQLQVRGRDAFLLVNLASGMSWRRAFISSD